MTDEAFLLAAVDGARTEIIEDVYGIDQDEFALRVGQTDRTIRYWRAKQGRKIPGPESIASIYSAFEFTERFLYERRGYTKAVPLFHKRSKTYAPAIRRARGFLQLTGDVADELTNRDLLPGFDLPDLHMLAPEDAASEARRWLGLGSEPIANLSRLLEARGIVLTMAPLDEKSIHSYSDVLFSRPLVFSNARSGDRYRSRFFLGHELAHLLMHPRKVTAYRVPTAEEEASADAFAAELLTPARALEAELKGLSYRERSSADRQDGNWVESAFWRRVKDLKERWGVEMSSILRRAKAVRALTDDEYSGAILEYAHLSDRYRKAMLRITRGREVPVWLTFDEPGDDPHIEEPALLPNAIDILHDSKGGTFLSEHLGIPQRFIDAMASPTPTSINLGLPALSRH